MPDEPKHVTSSIRPLIRASDAPPPDAIVRELHASLLAGSVYAQVLIDQIALSRAIHIERFNGVPAGMIAHLTTAAEQFQSGVARVLHCIDPDLAHRAASVADLARGPAFVRDEATS